MTAFVAYIGSIVFANWLLAVFGVVPIGFGMYAPAGVLAAGVALTLRDLVQDAKGRRWTLGAIVGGAVLSWFASPSFAVASGVAFLVSELADMAVYGPLRRRWWLGAIALSNTVGLVVDSALFLWLAFGSLDFLAGQVVGKLYVTVATVLVLWWVRRQRRPVVAAA